MVGLQCDYHSTEYAALLQLLRHHFRLGLSPQSPQYRTGDQVHENSGGRKVADTEVGNRKGIDGPADSVLRTDTRMMNEDFSVTITLV